MEKFGIKRTENPYYFTYIKQKNNSVAITVPASIYRDELNYSKLPNLYRRSSANCLICGTRFRNFNEHLQTIHQIACNSEASIRHRIVINANFEKFVDRQILSVKDIVEWTEIPDIFVNETIKDYQKRLKSIFLKRFCIFHEAAGGYVYINEKTKLNDLLKSGLNSYKLGQKPDFNLPPPFGPYSIEEWKALRIRSLIAPKNSNDNNDNLLLSSSDDELFDIENYDENGEIKSFIMEIRDPNAAQVIDNSQFVNNVQTINKFLVADSYADEITPQNDNNEIEILHILSVPTDTANLPFYYVILDEPFSFN